LPLDAPHTAQAAVRFNRVVARPREWAVEAGPEVVARFALERLRHRPESAKSGLAGRKPTSPD
jgi:hypothetical protein